MESKLESITPEAQEETSKALTLVESANSLLIRDVTSYRYAQVTMREVKDRIKELTETRMAQTRPLDESKAKIIAFFSVPLEKLEKAKNYLNNIMVRFTEDEEAKRREDERRLQEDARKRAEEETLQEAINLESSGDIDIAEALLAAPVYVPPIKVMSEIPKSKESHIRETWNAEGFDLMATVKAIAEGKDPLQSVQYDMTFLNGQARSYKQALNITGVRSVSKKTQI